MTKDNIALAALLQTKEACWEGGVPPDHKVAMNFYNGTGTDLAV